VRLLGVQASSFEVQAEQINLLEGGRQQRWRDALAAADRLRDRFGESSVKLAAGLRGNFRERTHENPAGLPGKLTAPTYTSRFPSYSPGGSVEALPRRPDHAHLDCRSERFQRGENSPR